MFVRLSTFAAFTFAAFSFLVGCDTAGSNEDLPEIQIEVDARPQGVFEVSCTASVVSEGETRSLSRSGAPPYVFPETRGTSATVSCHHLREEEDAAILARIVVDGEPEAEEEAVGPFASVLVSWPERAEATASWGLETTDGEVLPLLYDRFTADGAGQRLVGGYEVPSASLADTLRAGLFSEAGRSSGVFFQEGERSADRQRLFTPRRWAPGTSYSHVDANSNGLMLPFARPGTANLDPQSASDVLRILGWPAPGAEPPVAMSPGSRQRARADRIQVHQAAAVADVRCSLPTYEEFQSRSGRPVAGATRPDRHEQHSRVAALESSSADSSLFTFDFRGDWPEEAREAMREAGRIWSFHLGSRVPIAVVARWGGDNTPGLASGAPISYVSGFALSETLYPAPLANALAGEDLTPDQAEIDIVANPDAPWFYPARYDVPEGRASMVTVLLHEMAHGLGYLGSMRVAR